MVICVLKFVPWRSVFIIGIFFFVFSFNLTYLFSQEDCLECHGEPDLTYTDDAGNEMPLFVNMEGFEKSIHGEFGCVSCHMDAEEIPHEEKLKNVDCAECHEDSEEQYKLSIHASAKRLGITDAPSCIDCHGKHDILPTSNPESRTHPLKLASTCATCHANPKIVKKYNIFIPDPLGAYNKSVHGVALISEQNFDVATCNSCHGSHDIRKMGDPESTIYWKNVPEMCGQCHGDIYEQYTESVHWYAAEQGLREAPVCTDCHGEHQVRSPKDPESPLHPLRVSAETCGRCHDSEIIVERFGIAEERVATFEDSYHGLAIKGGSLAAANCASCHGIHSILPASDLRSSVHPKNLTKTCGNCHPGLTENWVKGPIHITTSTRPGRIVQYVRDFYIMLIVIVIGAMLLHNGADFIRRTKRMVRKREKE